MVEEQFGPVLPLIKFSDDDDALARANASPCGPFGGAKSSGIGRELGEDGLAEFTQLQMINIAGAARAAPDLP